MSELTVALIEAEIIKRLEHLRHGTDPYSDYFNAMDDGARDTLRNLLKFIQKANDDKTNIN